MADDDFFNESPREQSVVKMAIVEAYFDTWSRIVSATLAKGGFGDQRLAYVDLFAGRGYYGNGTPATPLRVTERAISNPDLCSRLVLLFNDANADHARELEKAISAVEGVGRLRHKPKVSNVTVGQEMVDALSKQHTVPMLVFIDPYGYKGLSLDLINAAIKDWGCDCIFFFNYKRVNPGLNNDAVRPHMEALFGPQAAASLRTTLAPLSPADREVVIVEALANALGANQGKYVLPFCFKDGGGKRTSHHLVLVTKHHKGYEVMKEIMAKHSSEQHQGVPGFVFMPAASQSQGLLFDLNRPLDDLPRMLLNEFAGTTMSMVDVYRQHNVGKPFLKRHYKEVLRDLLHKGEIAAKPTPRKGTFGDTIEVTFPPLER